MKIAYFGGDMFYDSMQFLLQNNHEIMALFTVLPKNGEFDCSQNICKQAKMLNIPVIYSRPTAKDIANLQKNGCEMILSAGYSYKIPPWEGGNILYGVNIHPSLLPEGGGPMPLPLVIIKGLKQTGVTLHKLSQDFDAGDIILQENIPLLGTENLDFILYESQKSAVNLLRNFFEAPLICWKRALRQNPISTDYWPLSDPSEFVVDYTKDLETVARHLRAHRFIDVNGMIESVSGVSFWKKEHEFEPGTILSRNKDVHLAVAKDGFVCFKLEKSDMPKYNFILHTENKE